MNTDPTATVRRAKRNQSPSVFTTTQVARFCNVAARTVSQWIDRGTLPGYRLPGSRDRRVTRECLVQFLRRHQIPLGDLARNESPRILLVGVSDGLAEALATRHPDWELSFSRDPISAAFDAALLRPDCLIVDLLIHPDRAELLGARLRVSLDTVLIATSDTPLSRPAGFDDLFLRPFDAELLAARIWTLMERRRVSP